MCGIAVCVGGVLCLCVCVLVGATTGHCGLLCDKEPTSLAATKASSASPWSCEDMAKPSEAKSNAKGAPEGA